MQGRADQRKGRSHSKNARPPSTPGMSSTPATANSRRPGWTEAKPSLKRRKTNRTATAPNQTTAGTFVLRFTQTVQPIAFPVHDYSSFPKLKPRWNLHYWAGLRKLPGEILRSWASSTSRLPTTPANAAGPAPGRFSWSCPNLKSTSVKTKVADARRRI